MVRATLLNGCQGTPKAIRPPRPRSQGRTSIASALPRQSPLFYFRDMAAAARGWGLLNCKTNVWLLSSFHMREPVKSGPCPVRSAAKNQVTLFLPGTGTAYRAAMDMQKEA